MNENADLSASRPNRPRHPGLRPSVTAASGLLARGLEEAGDPADTPAVLASVAVEPLRLVGAAVDGPGLRPAVVGVLDGDPVPLPIGYRGEQVGRLWASPRPGETALTRHDRQVLAELARRAGPALHAAAHVAELTDARARSVAAAEDERRRLRPGPARRHRPGDRRAGAGRQRSRPPAAWGEP